MSGTLLKAVVLGGVLVAASVAERVRRWSPEARRRAVSRARNLPIAAFNLVAVPAVCAACVAAGSRAGIGPLRGAPGWVAWPVTIAALDLLSYGWHRANHRIGLLWRFHAFHHSDPLLDATSSLRFHPVELIASVPIRLLAVILLGAPAGAVIAFEIVFGVANIVEHADLRVARHTERALARWLIVPATHRIHHSRRVEELSSNFGTVFAVWDRLFGTWREGSSARDVDVGVDGMPAAPLAALLAAFRSRPAGAPAPR